jgi:arsenite methyltransferase
MSPYLKMDYMEIDKRYSVLAEPTCCLSCGGAINYSQAAEGDICVDLGGGRGTDAISLTNLLPISRHRKKY